MRILLCIWVIKTFSGWPVFPNQTWCGKPQWLCFCPKHVNALTASERIQLGFITLFSLPIRLMKNFRGVLAWSQEWFACCRKHSTVVFLSHLGQILNRIKALLELCFILKDASSSQFIVNLNKCMWCSQVIVINLRASVNFGMYLNN